MMRTCTTIMCTLLLCGSALAESGSHLSSAVKENIEPLPLGLEAVEKLQPVAFQRKKGASRI